MWVRGRQYHRIVKWSSFLSAVGDRAKPRPAVNGADSAYHASDGRARSGSAVRLVVVRPGQGDDGMGRERPRRLVHIRRRSRRQISAQTRP